MTLAPIPGSFRPGAATTPQPTEAESFVAAAKNAHLKFLTAEERATATLMGFFEEARLDLETFIRTGDLSVSDATFYRQLLDETNRIASSVNDKGATWVTETIPEGYSAGWRTWSTVVVPQGALEALSRDTLSLIRATSEGMRLAVRQSIAAGILQGLSGADVRARILATGLTNIPHWPTVEYRAGVIARTETMKAYNAGALDGIIANGARFARWIASPDEATCPICLPRNRQVYRLPESEDLPNDPYPNALPLPKLPAHPRCRCTIRAEYRDPDGNVIRATAPETQPGLPKDAMGGRDAPTLPAAAGDLANAFGKLGAKDFGDYATTQAFWRGLGRLTDDELRLLTHGMTGARGNAAFSGFLHFRYGIAFPKPLGWTPELRLSTLRALERIREKWPRYVVDSRYLQTLGEAPPGARRFGSNTIARAFPTGHVQGNMKLWETFAGPSGRKLRAGDIDAAEEVILHEFMHTIHFRYGLYDPAVYSRSEIRQAGLYAAAESVDSGWHDEFGALRRASTRTAPEEGELSSLERRLASYREKADKAPEDSFERRWATNMVEHTEGQIAKLREQLSATAAEEYYPTSYARQSVAEDFAESAMLYFLNPAHLKKWSPGRFEFLRTKVFVE